MKLFKNNFIIKASLLYCGLSGAFSFVGLLFATKVAPIINPLHFLTLEEVGGHLVWGLVVGIVSLNLRYVLLSGVFAVLIDSDHLIQLLHTDVLLRTSHSILFGLIAVIVLMTIFGRKDYRLGAVVFAALLSHVSFDIFYGDPKFPFFLPFSGTVSFPTVYWLYFEIAAIVLVGIVTIISKKKTFEKFEV